MHRLVVWLVVVLLILMITDAADVHVDNDHDGIARVRSQQIRRRRVRKRKEKLRRIQHNEILLDSRLLQGSGVNRLISSSDTLAGSSLRTDALPATQGDGQSNEQQILELINGLKLNIQIEISYDPEANSGMGGPVVTIHANSDNTSSGSRAETGTEPPVVVVSGDSSRSGDRSPSILGSLLQVFDKGPSSKSKDNGTSKSGKGLSGKGTSKGGKGLGDNSKSKNKKDSKKGKGSKGGSKSNSSIKDIIKKKIGGGGRFTRAPASSASFQPSVSLTPTFSPAP